MTNLQPAETARLSPGLHQHFLTEQRLLNSQTGEHQPLTLTREGTENTTL
jgi:hypothetical protein